MSQPTSIPVLQTTSQPASPSPPLSPQPESTSAPPPETSPIVSPPPQTSAVVSPSPSPSPSPVQTSAQTSAQVSPSPIETSPAAVSPSTRGSASRSPPVETSIRPSPSPIEEIPPQQQTSTRSRINDPNILFPTGTSTATAGPGLEGSSSSNTILVAGIVVGCLLFVLLIVTVLFFAFRRSYRSINKRESRTPLNPKGLHPSILASAGGRPNSAYSGAATSSMSESTVSSPNIQQLPASSRSSEVPVILEFIELPNRASVYSSDMDSNNTADNGPSPQNMGFLQRTVMQDPAAVPLLAQPQPPQQQQILLTHELPQLVVAQRLWVDGQAVIMQPPAAAAYVGFGYADAPPHLARARGMEAIVEDGPRATKGPMASQSV
ncbi:hypothetical protein BJ742DRAFT_853043 [Cladochytrium replicatum]|nr:hypothetical protein BJ742DRAFT_853043 [Cladochytrium replicatum]